MKAEHRGHRGNAAIEALAKIMPRSKDKALMRTALFEQARVGPAATGNKALKEMLEAGAIERIGQGGRSDPCRYWCGEK